MSQVDHSEPLLLLALFYQSTPSCLKVRCGGGGVGGPVAHVILVSVSVLFPGLRNECYERPCICQQTLMPPVRAVTLTFDFKTIPAAMS